jgi:ribosomal protein L11
VPKLSIVEPNSVAVLPPPTAALVKDAASIRKICVKALRQFRQGQISIQEARQVDTLSKRALDAMKMEYLATPRPQIVAGADDED